METGLSEYPVCKEGSLTHRFMPSLEDPFLIARLHYQCS